MKNTKLILLLTLLIIISSTTVVTAEVELPDIEDHWAEDFIRELVDMGAITGYPDGSYRPENNISRAEFASVLRGALGLEEVEGETFSDTFGHWGEGRIEALIKEGIIDTDLYEENYSPDGYITREKIAMMTVRMLGAEISATETPFLDEEAIGDGYNEYVAEAYAKGIITGYPDTTFRPAGTATRAEAATMVIRTLGVDDSPSEEEDPITTAPTIDFFVSDDTTISQGETALLEWEVSDADTVTITPILNQVSSSGSDFVSPTETTTYTLTASNSVGSNTADLTVNVEIEDPVTTAPTIDFFVADNTTIIQGGKALLEWEVSHADTVTITPVFNEVNSSGSAAVSPTKTTTYILSAENNIGISTADLTINVFGGWTPPPENGFIVPTPSIKSFSTDKSIMTEGLSATLSWEVKGFGQATIQPDIGEVDLTGTMSVSPEETTTYTLTAGNVSGIVEEELEITVEPEKIIQPGPKDGKDSAIATVVKGKNYSNANYFSIGKSSSYGYISRALIQFDISDLPSNAVINSAYLDIYQVADWVTGDFTIDLHKITSNWDLDTVSWNNPVSFNPTERSTVQVTGEAENYLSWDIKNLMQNWVNKNTNNYGVLLKKTDESSKGKIECWSSNNTSEPDLRPLLRIKYYVP